MLFSTHTLKHYVLQAQNGTLGQCADFLFDDKHWTVRYMVADTQKWLPGRKVLVSPISIGTPDAEAKLLPVALTKEQVKASPSLDAHAPVSQQFERSFTKYYNYGLYWTGSGLWGASAYPMDLLSSSTEVDASVRQADDEDRNLRSANEVAGYAIRATDDELGHVDSFLIDAKTWNVNYLIVDTRNWLPGRKVVIPTPWVEKVDWTDRAANIGATKSVIESAPTYEAGQELDAGFEAALLRYAHTMQWSSPRPESKRRLNPVDEVLKQSFPASDPPPY